MTQDTTIQPTDAARKDHYFMGFTPASFYRNPHVFDSAAGNYIYTTDGQRVFDGFSGLWCTGMGHCHPRIADAVATQIRKLDYVAAFNMSHPAAFTLAERIANMAPDPLDHVFFTSSGSESIDTAIKLAIGYHKLRGEAGRFRVIGRERGYHGVGFGGLSIGGMLANRRMFASAMLPGVDHLSHTYDREHQAFTHGQPAWGAHLAGDLEKLIALHGADTIAAVVVEPMAGSTGVLVPPVGYLEALRRICTQHGILLVFDEVICGFGRMGTPFAAQRFNVVPDMITFAKTITNGNQPMGGVIMSRAIHDTFMNAPEYAATIYHGYTYSAHPVAVAAAHASLDVLEDEGMIAKAAALEPLLDETLHTLKGEPHVVDIRNIGLAGAVEFAPLPGEPGKRGFRIAEKLLADGFYLRWSGDQVTLAPPFTATPDEIVAMVDALRNVIRQLA